MVSTPALVRAQLSEALSVISSYEFPGKWPTLLPELISRLESGDASTVHGVLETANSIYKRYRNQFMSTALSDELSYSQQFVQPLLKSLQVGHLNPHSVFTMIASVPFASSVLQVVHVL